MCPRGAGWEIDEQAEAEAARGRIANKRKTAIVGGFGVSLFFGVLCFGFYETFRMTLAIYQLALIHAYSSTRLLASPAHFSSL